MKNKKEKTAMSTKKYTLISIAIIFAVVNLIAVLYVLLSKNFYYWSTAESWNIAIKIAQGAYHPNLFYEIYKSISTLEVNYLSALPSALFVFAFGQSRLVYVLSLVNCYVAPFLICVFFMAKKIGKSPAVTLAMTFLLMPATMYMALMGFAEIGGVTFGMLCMYLYLCDSEKKKGLALHIAIGLLLTLTTLWSHVYIFFSAAFITAMVADSIMRKKSVLLPLIPLLCMVLLMILFFRSYIPARVVSLYGNINLALNMGTNLKFVLRYLGLVFILALLIQSASIVRTNGSSKITFLWIDILLCYIMLITTRTHGQLHILMYIPAFTVLSILSIKHINDMKTLVFAIVLAIVQTVCVFIPRTQPSSVEEIKGYSLFPSFSSAAKVRTDYEQILDLKLKLDAIIGENEYLGVLSYSDKLNPDLLNNAQISANHSYSRRNYIAFTIPYFDDITPNIEPLCNANYMLVATPLQAAYDNQQILSKAVESFINYTDIARAYTELYEYNTNIDGVDIKVFHRVRNVFEFEKRDFISKLNN